MTCNITEILEEWRNVDEHKVKTGWERRGFSFGIWNDPPGQIWENYIHGVDELLMLVEGEIELSFLGKTFRPKIGEEILIPAGASHTVRNIGNSANRWCYGYKQR
ncbi:MAG TPA: cupin domain-containing protein [Burkholderiales bacterium]|nr:cupin domain-containing protein [Burkholderiales bacterium]